MMIQISSGCGPAECEIAVGRLCEALLREFRTARLVESHEPRRANGGLTSAVIEADEDMSALDGTVEWICKSPLRPHHKRRNWFIDVSVLPDAAERKAGGRIRAQFFRCGGNGGQNVNKVETGVRLVDEDTGIAVKCTEERGQAMNRRRAERKMADAIAELRGAGAKARETAKWRESTRLVRGNPVRVYEGEDFTLRRN